MNYYLVLIILFKFVCVTFQNEEWKRLLYTARGLRPLNYPSLMRLEEIKSYHMDLQIDVDRRKLSIKINKNEILAAWNTKSKNDTLQWDHLGIHVLVLDEATATVLARKRFITNQPSSSDDMTIFINNVQDGRLLIFIGVQEWLLFFDINAARILQGFGFQEMERICNGEAWIGLTVKGSKRILAEILTTTAFHKELSSPLHFNHHFEKIPESLGYHCKWHSFELMKERKDFCQRFEGYGDLCSCNKYFEPGIRKKQEKIAIREEIPIVIVAATKPQSLYRLLRNLFTIPGTSQTSILIVSDGYREEILRLASIFNLPVRIHHPEGKLNGLTNTNIRFALSVGFEVFPVDKVIILEEDLTVSPDFIRYFQETSWVLDNDPTVYCVNAFSYNSLEGVAESSQRILRVEGYPWYGWMVKKQYALQVISHWVKHETGYDWDWWLLWEDQRRNRDVLVPEISRVFHSGGSGAHVTSVEQHLYYNRIIINRDSNPKAQSMKSLLLPNYTKKLKREISKAEFITLDLLKEEKLPEEGTGPFVTFIKSGTTNDEFQSFETIQKSFKTYFWDVREHFRGVMIFRIKGRALYVVGCPLSVEFCPLNYKFPMLIVPSRELIHLVEIQNDRFEQSLSNFTFRTRVQEINIS